MTLDNRLKVLQGLEVGNVERVIGDVVRTNERILSSKENYEQEFAAYKEIFKEKLEQTLHNICLLGEHIFQLEDRSDSFYPVQVGDDTQRIGLQKLRGDKNYGLVVESFMHYNVGVIFENETHSLKEFSLSLYDYPNVKHLFKIVKSLPTGQRKDYLLNFRAKDISEFVSKSMNFFETDVEKANEKYRLYSLPLILNLAPSLLTQMYSKTLAENTSRLNDIVSKKTNVSGLDTSDFK